MRVSYISLTIATKLNNKMKTIIETPNAPEPIGPYSQAVLSGNTLYTSGQISELIERFVNSKPILGVCLGCQALGEYFGAELFNMRTVKHGLQTPISIIDNSCLFRGISSEIKVGRYHSWAINIKGLESLIATAFDADNVLMSFRHTHLPIYGIQFHPESIMTPKGKQIIENRIAN